MRLKWLLAVTALVASVGAVASVAMATASHSQPGDDEKFMEAPADSRRQAALANLRAISGVSEAEYQQDLRNDFREVEEETGLPFEGLTREDWRSVKDDTPVLLEEEPREPLYIELVEEPPEE